MMAEHGKEERIMTVYADVHYYFSAPTPRPLSHRFDKGSYLYLYRNTSDHGGRIEVANNVGKPEQDAFTGALDTVKVCQSHKHPTLCTVTVDGYQPPSPPPLQHSEHQWRLPNTDPRNEGKYLFRLHTVDIYFWKAADATTFVDSVERLVEAGQMEILDRPLAPAAHENLMSPVVQKLENVAVEDSAYQNGQTRNSRSALPVFSPPPTASNETSHGAPKSNDPESFKPLAYNPAAPPAPEKIKPREKTPPPPEAETEGTGLSAAACHDHHLGHTMSPLSHPRHGSMSQPPYPSSLHSSAYSSPQPYGNTYSSPPPPPFTGSSGVSPAPGVRMGNVSSVPPPPPQGGRTSSVASAQAPYSPPSTQLQGPSSATSLQPSFGAPPRDPNAFNPAGNKPLDSPSAQILGNSYVGPPPQPLQHLQPQYADYLANRPQHQHAPQGQTHDPSSGYSNHHYGQHHQHHHHSHQHGGDYDVHNQLYRPTEEEARQHKHHRPSDGGQPSGKLEQQAGKLDKGVNRFFKKLEKRIG
ncbi:MAG: hypothetical protein LQ339_000513 [Xanthoria mediterranea]|nr:MAG: hypothetical protein LQ339_000513 [Xanthoria mediterranea]